MRDRSLRTLPVGERTIGKRRWCAGGGQLRVERVSGSGLIGGPSGQEQLRWIGGDDLARAVFKTANQADLLLDSPDLTPRNPNTVRMAQR